MGTFLFGDIIFGPIQSRRLGVSLGVNLLPVDNKLCNFDCIYCECGWSTRGEKMRFNSREDVARLLEEKLKEMSKEGVVPDVITFAGNGEPTMHPHFAEIIDDTIALRDRYCPEAKVSVLSNATMIGRESVREALLRVDNNILKLDSAFEQTAQLINIPSPGYSIEQTVEWMKWFEGRLIIQTMFLRGKYRGKIVDNTTPEEVSAWLKLVEQIAPKQVMIYSLDRATPAENLQKVSVEELRTIAKEVEQLGIECSVAE